MCGSWSNDSTVRGWRWVCGLQTTPACFKACLYSCAHDAARVGAAMLSFTIQLKQQGIAPHCPLADELHRIPGLSEKELAELLPRRCGADRRLSPSPTLRGILGHQSSTLPVGRLASPALFAVAAGSKCSPPDAYKVPAIVNLATGLIDRQLHCRPPAKATGRQVPSVLAESVR